MAGPVSGDDRARTLRWLKLGTVVLVGLSAGSIAAQGGASVELIAGAALAGLLVGVALVWYLFPDAEALAPASKRRYRE